VLVGNLCSSHERTLTAFIHFVSGVLDFPPTFVHARHSFSPYCDLFPGCHSPAVAMLYYDTCCAISRELFFLGKNCHNLCSNNNGRFTSRNISTAVASSCVSLAHLYHTRSSLHWRCVILRIGENDRSIDVSILFSPMQSLILRLIIGLRKA
jgi:hypothetical protein